MPPHTRALPRARAYRMPTGACNRLGLAITCPPYVIRYVTSVGATRFIGDVVGGKWEDVVGQAVGGVVGMAVWLAAGLAVR